MIGKRVDGGFVATSTLLFQDSNGGEWLIETQELFPHDTELLASNQTVRVLGKVMEQETKIFHACGVFPWMMSAAVTRKQMSEQREVFVSSARKMAKEVENELAILETVTFADASAENTPSMKVCADIAAIRRVTQTAR